MLLLLILSAFAFYDTPIKISDTLFEKEAFITSTFNHKIDSKLLGFGLIIMLLLLLLLKVYKTNLLLLKAIKGRERFFALFSHDLRSVIINLKDSGEVLNYLIKNQRLDEIQEISRQLDYDGFHALSLLNNMLDWGTLTGYSYQPRFRNFLLTDKVWYVVNTYKPAIESKDIQLNIEIENGLGIYSDEKSIDVVLRNIIANAKAYTPAGGSISICLEKHNENQLAFIVENSVARFKKDNLVHIQNVLSGKTKPNLGHQGLGLGIILIHEYAKNCDFGLELSFENDFVTFKVLMNYT